MKEKYVFGFRPYYMILEAYLPLTWCVLRLTCIKDRLAFPKWTYPVGGGARIRQAGFKVEQGIRKCMLPVLGDHIIS